MTADEHREICEEIQRRMADTVALTAAIGRAVRQAVLRHEKAGNPVAESRDGKVVLVPPEEIDFPEEPE